MPNRDIIVIGASAGGLEALREIVRQLPRDFPAAVFIVRHIPAYSRSALPEILGKVGNLPVDHATDGEPIRRGKIYIAPPDRHLVLEADRVRLTTGPKENRFRPAVDPLFRSAAHSFGPRVVGVILTGALDDGTAGLWAIKDRGGIAVVQDPADAQQSSMPMSTSRNVRIDYSVPVAQMAALLVRLVDETVRQDAEPAPSERLRIETRIGLEDKIPGEAMTKIGDVSQFTCPNCQGTLLKLQDGELMRFRCFTGHALSKESLLADLTESVEKSLWNAIRAVEERVRLLKHLAQHGKQIGGTELAVLLTEQAEDAKRCADLVRQAALLHETGAKQR